MATNLVEIAPGDGWVELTVNDYLVQNPGPIPLLLTQQVAAPTVDAPYHVLYQGQAMVKVGSGSLYGKAGSSTGNAKAVVTD